MKKVIKLTESDLIRIVKRVISEQSDNTSFDKYYDEMLSLFDDYQGELRNALETGNIQVEDAYDYIGGLESEFANILDNASEDNKMLENDLTELEHNSNELLRQLESIVSELED